MAKGFHQQRVQRNLHKATRRELIAHIGHQEGIIKALQVKLAMAEMEKPEGLEEFVDEAVAETGYLPQPAS